MKEPDSQGHDTFELFQTGQLSHTEGLHGSHSQTDSSRNDNNHNSNNTNINIEEYDMFPKWGNPPVENKSGNPGYGGFDSMLEVLPDDITFDSFFHHGIYTNSSHSSTNKLSNTTPTPKNNNNEDVVMHENSVKSPQTQSHPSIFDHVVSTAPKIATTQPINISGTNGNNLQNGEIPQLWDFTTDTFQMTPSNSSDSATISAPNSFNSESNHALHFQSQFNNNNNNNIGFMHNSSYSNPNFMNMAQSDNNNIPHTVTNFSSAFNNNNSPNYNNNNNNNATSIFKQPVRSRKSSLSQTNFPDHMNNNDNNSNEITTGHKPISIPLSINNTSNSIRKSQSFARQISSTSLTNMNLNKRNSSISELSTSSNMGSIVIKKPPTQCHNCKTFKTPLWRRDPNGNTLCNACGLFQKLHGTMRPLSLKSDVIKKRNTKKRIKKNQEAMIATNSNETLTPSNINNTSNIAKNIVPRSIVQPTATTAMTATTTTNANMKKKSLDHSLLTATTTTKVVNTTRNGVNSNRINSLSLTNINSLNSNGIAGNRRNSTSSNASSRSSSSRSVVPILPKPTTSSNNNVPFNSIPSTFGTLSANTSTASSPRYMNNYPTNNNNSNNNNFNMINGGNVNVGNSPLQTGTFSTSMGRFSTGGLQNGNNANGINMSRRKTPRNASYSSSSSSFIANSLQNLQNMQQQQAAHGNQRVSSPQISASWNSTSNKLNRVASNSKMDSPSKISQYQQQPNFELFYTANKKSQYQPEQVPPPTQQQNMSHTSLLSQQLQQNPVKIPIQSIPETDQHEYHSNNEKVAPMSISNQNSPSLRNNRSSFNQSGGTPTNPSNSNMTNSYTETVQFQRHGSFQQQSHMNPQSTNSPLFQDSTTSTTQQQTPQDSDQGQETSKSQQTKVADELEWLKFGM
ncbi:nitrogen regulatory protein Gln3p [Monosporozyma unispora]|nr:hypothetical protein C6P44_003072 [Kazachstania unispora]